MVHISHQILHQVVTDSDLNLGCALFESWLGYWLSRQVSVVFLNLNHHIPI
jgi:hypothetical protein